MTEVKGHNEGPAGPNDLDAHLREFKDWMLVERARAPTTARVRRAIVADLLATKGFDVTPADVEERKRAIILGGRTRDHARNTVFAFRDYFDFRGIPHALVPPKKGARKTPRFLTADEVSAFLAAIEDTRDRALFYLLAYSGLRVHEIVKLRAVDVALDAHLLTIEGKGGKSETIPFGAPAVEPLRSYMETRKKGVPTLFYGQADGYAGPQQEGDGLPLSDVRVRVLTRRYAKKAGLRRATPHMFRHALATNLLDNGCPLPFVQRQLRHTRIETTMMYVHPGDRSHRTNFDKFLPDYSGARAGAEPSDRGLK